MPVKQTKKNKKNQVSGGVSSSKWKLDPLMISYLIVAIAVLLVGARFYLDNVEFESKIPKDTMQAVFLTNGQVYIGHLKPIGRKYLELTDVYYIQSGQINSGVQDGVSPRDPVGGETEIADQDAQLSIVRLGDEVHQPKNEIILNKAHLLFWENLKLDSQIIDAINKYDD